MGHRTDCIGDEPEDVNHWKDVRRVLSQAEFKPATVDGMPEEVSFFVRVAVAQHQGRCVVLVYSNLGQQTDEFGYDYIAPQLRAWKHPWYAQTKGRFQPVRLRQPWDWHGSISRRGLWYAMSVSVDESGNAGESRLEAEANHAVGITADFLKALERSMFIPAFVGDEPVPARFYTLRYIW